MCRRIKGVSGRGEGRKGRDGSVEWGKGLKARDALT